MSKGPHREGGGAESKREKYMYTAGTGWSRERRRRRVKACGNFGFRGAGNSGPEADFYQVRSKIGNWKMNATTGKVEAGLAHRRHAFL